MELPYKKRHRVPASCSVCRKRKLKCDRVKPVCGSCKKKSIAHLCYYGSESFDGAQSLGVTYLENPQFPSSMPPPMPDLIPHPIHQNGHNPSPPQSHVQQPLQQFLQLQQLQLGPLGPPTNGFSPQSSTHSTSSVAVAPPHQPTSMAPSSTLQSGSPKQVLNESGARDLSFNSSVTPKTNEPASVTMTSPQYQYPTSNPFASPQDSTYISPGSSSIISNVPFPQNISHSRQQLRHIQPPQAKLDQAPEENVSENMEDFVSVPLGTNTMLKVHPEDTIEVFTNASFSLNLEGPLWQLQGTFSYIGLTKSDPFIKIIRNYAILLFQSGEMTKYIKSDPLNQPFKRRKINQSAGSSVISDLASPSSKRPKNDDRSPMYDNNDTTNENGNVYEDDTLIVTRINKGDENEDGGYDNDNVNRSSTDGQKTDQNGGLQEGKGSHKQSCSIDIPNLLPGLSKLYTETGSHKEYYKVVEQAILAILPDKLNSFVLFCRYFKYVHPFIPIIDEKTILLDLDNIFGSFPSFSREKYSEILIENDHSLSILGIFLLITRLGYMSLIHNDNVEYDEDEKSIMNHMKKVKSETFSRILHLCIGDAAIQSKSSFQLVQELTLLHFYRLVDPKDCHGLGGADAHILFGVIMKHAMSIGLNRDPTFYVAHDRICKNESLIKTWRALWHYLVFVDASASIHCGSCLNIGNLDMSDVHLPTYDDVTGKLNELVRSIGSICQSYRRIVTKINNVQNKPKVVEILQETTKLEKLFYSLFGKDYFKEYVCIPASLDKKVHQPGTYEHESSCLKVQKFGIFIQLRTNLSCMYYMIAIHYENERNISKSKSMNAGLELFKIYIKSVVQLVYIMSYVLDNSIDLFGRNYDYIITAANERCMIKAHSFLTSFFVRLLHHKRNLAIRLLTDPSVKSRLAVTDRLFTLVVGESELFVGNFRRLSQKYMNSYKLYIMTYFVLKQSMENPDAFFNKTINDPHMFHHGTNTLEFFTINELEYLCKLCEEFKSAKEEQLNIRKKQFPQRLDSSKFIQQFKKYDYVLPRDEPTANSSQKQQVTDSNDDPPEIDISDPDNTKINGMGSIPVPFKNANNIPNNSNTEEYGLSNFSYGMIENPNVDLLQLFELFGDIHGKDL